jgi:hypothetical protein
MLDMTVLESAAWGEGGALAFGFYMTIQAFKIVGAPGARTDALANLALGVFVGPLAAAVFQGAVLYWMPKLDPKAIDVTLGVIAVPAIPKFAAFVQDKFFSKGDGK